MEIRYTYTFEDYEALCEARARNLPRYSMRKWSIWIVAAANVAMGIWLISSDLSAGQPVGTLGLFLIALAVFLLFLHFFLSPWSRRRAFKSQMLGSSETVVTIDETGISSRGEASESSVEWSGVIRADNEPEHVIFWTSHIMGIAIPKIAISDTQMQEIDRLVNEFVIEKDQ